MSAEPAILFVYESPRNLYQSDHRWIEYLNISTGTVSRLRGKSWTHVFLMGMTDSEFRSKSSELYEAIQNGCLTNDTRMTALPSEKKEYL